MSANYGLGIILAATNKREQNKQRSWFLGACELWRCCLAWGSSTWMRGRKGKFFGAPRVAKTVAKGDRGLQSPDDGERRAARVKRDSQGAPESVLSCLYF